MANGILKKNVILPFVTMWMDLKNTMFSEISQRKEMLYDITYIQSEKQINVHSKIETESQIEKTN